ncbi:hypothetical protein DRN86_00275 [Candidatus Geothermarchaeota archaeon]|nr:MAG: hypothetical protein DRN86_00275 [Candidatus Geothermarchaeota archaeon]
MSNLIECPKCGAKNPKEAKFCLNCGARLLRYREPRSQIETVKYLFIVSLIYITLSFMSRTLWANYLLYIPFLLGFIIGLLTIVLFKKRIQSKLTWFLLVAYSSLGLTPTLFVLYAGLNAGDGLFSSGIIIFSALLLKLILDRGKFL